MTQVNDLVANFEYRLDGKYDTWRIMKPDERGRYVGDCDDFALTALYLVTGSLWRFWVELILGSAKIYYVWTERGGHAVLYHKGLYIDNWSMAWVTREYMEVSLGHSFSSWQFLWPVTIVKMVLGKFKG